MTVYNIYDISALVNRAEAMMDRNPRRSRALLELAERELIETSCLIRISY